MDAVAADGRGLVAAGQTHDVESADGDAVVLRSLDGRAWRRVAVSGLDGPGPNRVIAMRPDRSLALVERRAGALLTPSLFRTGRAGADASTGAWQEVADLPAADGGVAAASALLPLGPGAVVLGAPADDGAALVWSAGPDAARRCRDRSRTGDGGLHLR